MDFGIGFISNNIMLPIVDFFYGIVPSYGLAIVALTLVIRFALYPLGAGSIRNMRKTKISQPLMQKRVKEIQQKFKDDPAKQQQAMSDVYKEFGNPLAGCLPVLLQMPVLFALFATLRGSPFSNVDYNVNLQVVPGEQTAQIQTQAFTSEPHNIYFTTNIHAPVIASIPTGNVLAVGQKAQIEFKGADGKPFNELAAQYPDSKLTPEWTVTKGMENIKVSANGQIEAIAPGDVTIKGTVPGIAADTGFLFIDSLGHVGAIDPDGKIHWDIIAMIVFFGLSLYVSQNLSSSSATPAADDAAAQQQQAVNKFTPIIFSGMFLFFPLPAGVLMYMAIGNVFQLGQTYLVNREPLPPELQKLVEQQEREKPKDSGDREEIPFEKTNKKKKAT
ncbi:membrane protein insertase YidC [Chamaesiphon minutus]|uniref:Membrane protein insertase, YidC/Oxa1 family, C-terminal domain protein n=1 Tax=Chamaesiphon minutus (strain ATCC 27169 / PCC 6605) TaxID=1173020 RepID=K9UP59_CHAP6|nr:membrane protein insertase YidC [Chamaesiphon minutus]AFY96216.1 membrane protein insertase, YidC/Oxa1 family, C-terminal domain protein [Chamaesiphon minutus PCC 6605]